jgi:lipoprotein-anchoring transpeptidase ErfK/SrfK
VRYAAPATVGPREGEAPAELNDLQKRVAAIRNRLGEVVDGKSVDGTVYVPLALAVRLVGAELQWNGALGRGVAFADSGLTRFAVDTARVTIDEIPVRLSGPVRRLTAEPWLPAEALQTLHGAAVSDDEETGVLTLVVDGRELAVIVPDRAFHIEISRGGRWLKVRYAGRLAKEYPVCSGKGNNTPVGHFHIRNKAVWPAWRAYWGERIRGGSRRNPLGARWLGTSARGRATGWSIGIHGTNQPSSIGRRISGGCIRTYNHHAIELYDTIPIGTRVWIHE